jgi:hypothetical protein
MNRLTVPPDGTTVGVVELRQLEAFVAVARELHFGRAAHALHLGQPTLSDLVRRLEREVGTALFSRTTRRVALTRAGESCCRARSLSSPTSGRRSPRCAGWPTATPAPSARG